LRERALAEALQHARDLVLRDAGARVLGAEELTSGRGASDLQRDGAAGRGELNGVRQEVETDLPQRTLVCPKPP
jgi:hypothetical protein